MNDNIESPLATSDKRNRLAREPLRKQLLSKNPPKRSSHGNSPPNSQFTTSSPRDGEGSRAEDPDDITPGVSMIQTESKSVPRLEQSTRNSFKLDDSDEKTSKARRSRRLDKSVAESTEESDDDQPSGKISYRSHQEKATGMTPARNRSGTLVFPKESSPAANDYSSFTFGILFGIALIFITSFWINPNLTNTLTSLSYDANKSMTVIKQGFSTLERDFPNQDSESWATLRASFKGVFNVAAPTQPSVILLISEAKLEEVTKCLAKRLNSLALDVLNSNFTQEKPIHSGREFKNKNQLFETLEKDLENSASFLLYNLESLPGQSAMALHAFTDNINAPFKRAVIVFTLTSSSAFTTKEMDHVVERELTKSWSSVLDEDRISPILSRISVSSIQVKEDIPKKC